MNSIKASVNNIRISPEKVNLLVSQIRKLTPQDAVNILTLTNKSSAPVLKKLIKSALANARNNFNLKEEDLIFEKIVVTKGSMFKRYRPVSRGRAHHILKRTSHINLTLKTKPQDQVKMQPETAEVQIAEEKSNKIHALQQRSKNGTKS